MKKTSKKKPGERIPRRNRIGHETVWKRPTLEEIIAEQNGGRPTRVEGILGKGADLWDSDEEFEEFLDILKAAKASGGN